MSRHNYFTTCPLCGAHLDPGERCDCSSSGPEDKPQTTTKEANHEQQH